MFRPSQVSLSTQGAFWIDELQSHQSANREGAPASTLGHIGSLVLPNASVGSVMECRADLEMAALAVSPFPYMLRVNCF